MRNGMNVIEDTLGSPHAYSPTGIKPDYTKISPIKYGSGLGSKLPRRVQKLNSLENSGKLGDINELYGLGDGNIVNNDL